MIGVADRGIAFCVDTTDGSLLWQERIGGGEYSSSPLLAAGRVYLSSHQGRTVILRASREFEVLAENELDSDIMASPAVIGDALIVRTKDYVYRIEDK